MDGLTNLVGISNLTSLSSLLVSGNDGLTSMAGLEDLATVRGACRFSGNDGLPNFHGLDKLSSVGGTLTILANDQLASFEGLEELTMVSTFFVRDNVALTSFTGLEGLQFVNGTFRIQNNDALESLTGLDNLAIVEGSLDIERNDALTSLTGLGSLASIGSSSVGVSDNPSLPQCEAEAFAIRLATGCNCSRNDDAAVCNTCTENTCAGRGSCDDTSGEAVCTCDLGWDVQDNCASCADGFRGPECIADTTCTPSSCSGQGTCDDTLGQPVCMCDEGFLGPNCDGCRGTTECGGREIANDEDFLELRGCSSIDGNLRIRDTTVPRLIGLSCITSISGNLVIGSPLPPDDGDDFGEPDFSGGNTGLSSLRGLESLTSVGGRLGISDNPSLQSLRGLQNLTSVGNRTYIQRNPQLASLTELANLTGLNSLHIIGLDALTSLEGLEKLATIGIERHGFVQDDLIILDNASLSNLSALSNLKTIGGSLTIGRNDSLTNLSGFENLTRIGADLRVFSNHGLSNFDGLDGLTSIGSGRDFQGFRFGEVLVVANDGLENFIGLESLTSIGKLRIFANSNLSSLQGFESLATVEREFIVTDNPELPVCEAISLAAQTGKTCRPRDRFGRILPAPDTTAVEGRNRKRPSTGGGLGTTP